MPFATTWMGLETVILTEVSQTEKEKYSMASVYVESKKEWKIQVNLLMKQRLTDLENKLTVADGEKDRGRDS